MVFSEFHLSLWSKAGHFNKALSKGPSFWFILCDANISIYKSSFLGTTVPYSATIPIILDVPYACGFTICIQISLDPPLILISLIFL